MRIVLLLLLAITTQVVSATRYMEKLDRGVVAVKVSAGVFISWRLSGTESMATSFNIYRDGTKIATVTNSTNYSDASGSTSSKYIIKAVVNGSEIDASSEVTAWSGDHQTISLQQPATGSNGGVYSANDCSVGDLDGDGKYEIIVKWDPSNSQDNGNPGVTDKVYIDAYKMDGTFLWRIDLGQNIRAGAHYTQFMVYDFDNDGKAEIAIRTAPGTKDSKGNYLSKGAAKDNELNSLNTKKYAASNGHIYTNPEYLTVFESDGTESATITYQPARGKQTDWGDDYGNRSERHLAGVAYIDGVTPHIIMGRGYYFAQSGFNAKLGVAAFKYSNGALSLVWNFNADYNNNINKSYVGQGNHQLSIADVDGDGKDDIIYGACAIGSDGKGLYSTGLGHGDAMHVSDLIPSNPGLEVFAVHEDGVLQSTEIHDAKTGKILVSHNLAGVDVGRGMAADIDSTHEGFEWWSSVTGCAYAINKDVVNNLGNQQGYPGANSIQSNSRIYWDGDWQDELLDGTKLDKWISNGNSSRIKTFLGSGNNGSKNNVCLSADLFGDWREEVLVRTGNAQINIYTTTIPTDKKMYTLMHDPVYRLGIAWQNVAYNQPPHLGFYIAGGKIPTPDIKLAGNSAPTASIASPVARTEYKIGSTINLSASVIDAENNDSYVTFHARKGGTTDIINIGTDNSAPYTMAWTPAETGTYIVYVKAYDDRGAMTVSSLDYKLVVNDNKAPTVVIESPVAGTFLTTATINVSIKGSDSDGTVTKVSLNVVNTSNGQSEKIDNSSSATLSTTLSSLAIGTYYVIGTATDNDGAVFSDSVAITIEESTSNITTYVNEGNCLVIAPTPTDKSSSIIYATKESGKVLFTLYSSSGKKLNKIVKQVNKSNSGSFEWDAIERLLEGVYFIKMEVNGKAEAVAKLVKI